MTEPDEYTPIHLVRDVFGHVVVADSEPDARRIHNAYQIGLLVSFMFGAQPLEGRA